jgi:hypothetical protein
VKLSHEGHEVNDETLRWIAAELGLSRIMAAVEAEPE